VSKINFYCGAAEAMGEQHKQTSQQCKQQSVITEVIYRVFGQPVAASEDQKTDKQGT
jgi:hypothetical protein